MNDVAENDLELRIKHEPQAQPLGWRVVQHVDIAGPINRKGAEPVSVPQKEEVEKKNHTLNDYLNVGYAGAFGIEIELEGKNLPILDRNKYWSRRKDGSLRGGMEYVFNAPLDLKESIKAIDFLNKALIKSDAQLDYSFRTSVHVHVNVLSFTKKELDSFLYLSHLFEDVLVKYSGDSREGNRFCLRTRDAEDKVDQLKQHIREKDFRFFEKEKVKYSAINLSSIGEFGSVEFRSMRGTTDTAILIPWLEVLGSLRDIAKGLTIKEIAEAYKKDQGGLYQAVFKEHSERFYYPEMWQDMRQSYLRLIELPYL